MNGSKQSAMAGRGTVLAAVALALVAGPACRSGAPRAKAGAPMAPPDLLRAFVGQTLILRHRGDDKTVGLKRGQLTSLSGECDVVVEVRSAAFERGTARLNLQMIGRPRLGRRGARQERCGSDQPQTLLTVSGFEAGASANDLQSALGEVLQTPEAYLRAHGITFDLPAAAPAAAATPIPAPTAEHLLAARPERLLWADAIRQDPAHRVRHEGQVEIEGVVGPDGRLHDVRLLTPLSVEHEESVRRVLPAWRFQPGRRGAERVAVRVREQFVFRIYF